MNITFCYIDDVFSLNNYKVGDDVDGIYHIEIEIKHATYTARSAWYNDIEIDSEGRLKKKFYNKRKIFNVSIVNVPFTCSNIPAVRAYLSVDTIYICIILVSSIQRLSRQWMKIQDR